MLCRICVDRFCMYPFTCSRIDALGVDDIVVDELVDCK